MRAVRITRPGGPEVLEVAEVEDPSWGDDELCVAVRAVGINRADVLQRMGRYPAPAGAPADIPGLEYAGEVVAVGARVSGWTVGDRVMGLTGGGACAERVVVHAREAVRAPHGMRLTDAAAIPEAFITAWDAMFAQADLRLGEAVLIHAVGSGVGTAAVQLARAAGARTLGTSRTRDKLDRATELGLDVGILAEGGRFAEATLSATDGVGAQVAVDLVGGGYVPESLAALAPRGRLVLVGLLAGARAEINLGLVLGRRLSIRGTVLRSRPLEEKIAAAQGFSAQVLPLLDAGAVRPLVDAVYPLDAVAEAHRQMERGEVFGKIVLSI